MSKYNIKHLPKSQIEVSLEITPEEIAASYKKTLQKFVGSTQVKGFRKGKAPVAMVEATVGRDRLYEDALNAVIPEQLETSLNEEAKKNPDQRFIILDYPQFKIANEWKGQEPLNVTATCSIYPKIDLGKVSSSLKVKRETLTDPTQDQIDDATLKIFEQYKNIKAQQDKEQVVRKDLSVENPESSEVLMDDDFAKAAGAKDLEELKKMISEELKYEQQTKLERDFEEAMLKKALELVEIDLPDILVNEELNRIENRFKTQLDRLGITFESYLANENKTAEVVRNEWLIKAQENTKIALLLNEWRVFNNLVITEEEISRVMPKSSDKKVSDQEYQSIVYMLGQTKSLQHLKDHVSTSE
jgi:FKBP-type peptidyl-prolyl cis-trans isomerase (trigger factor)